MERREYAQRREMLEQWKREQEERERHMVQAQMECIEQRLNQSQVVHESYVQRVVSEARLRNETVQNKITAYKQNLAEKERMDKERY